MHAGSRPSTCRQVLPDFVGGEAEDGCDEADEGFGDLPEDGLCAAARGVGGREGVHAVFEDVDVEGTEVDDGELVDGVVDAVELEALVPAEDFFSEFAGAGQHVLVERQKLIEGNCVRAGLKPCRLPSRIRKVLRSLR